jgi:hypothetical protein
MRSSGLADLGGERELGDAYNFTVKGLQPLDPSRHLGAEQFRQAELEAKKAWLRKPRLVRGQEPVSDQGSGTQK